MDQQLAIRSKVALKTTLDKIPGSWERLPEGKVLVLALVLILGPAEPPPAQREQSAARTASIQCVETDAIGVPPSSKGLKGERQSFRVGGHESAS